MYQIWKFISPEISYSGHASYLPRERLQQMYRKQSAIFGIYFAVEERSSRSCVPFSWRRRLHAGSHIPIR
jgi:hypothetical protein